MIYDNKPLSVDGLIKNTHYVILHAITPHPHLRFTQLANGILSPSANMHDKVLALRLLSPTISASSFKMGRTHNRCDYAQSRFGVIIGSGQIIAASPQDENSLSLPDGSRKMQENNFCLTPQRIYNIVKRRNKNSPYNDLIIQNPKPAGVYLKLDPNKKEHLKFKTANDLVNVYDILNDMQITPDEVKLAKFVILNGQIRQLHRLRERVRDYLISDDSYEFLYRFNSSYKDLEDENDQIKQRKWKKLTEELTPTQLFERMFVLGLPLTPEQITQLSAEADLTLEEKERLSRSLEHSFSPTYKGIFDQRLGIEINYANTPDYTHDNIELSDVYRYRRERQFQKHQSLDEKNEYENKLEQEKLEQEKLEEKKLLEAQRVKEAKIKEERARQEKLREERIRKMYPRLTPFGNMFG